MLLQGTKKLNDIALIDEPVLNSAAVLICLFVFYTVCGSLK